MQKNLKLKLGQHRANASADLNGSFAPVPQGLSHQEVSLSE